MPLPSNAAAPVTGLMSGYKWDADGAGASIAVDVKKGSSYEYSEETTVETVGPYFGEGEQDVPTGDKYTWKMSFAVPEGGDTGQDAMFTARKSKVRGTLVLYTLKGKQITLTGALVTKMSLKTGAKGTQEVEAEGSALDSTLAAAATV